MALAGRTRRKVVFLLKILAVLAVVLTLWRLSLPSLRTSPDALNSYHLKMNQLELAHKNGLPMRVRIAAIELNSELDNWYHQMHIDTGWPPRGTVYYFKGARAGVCFPGYNPGNHRLFPVDVTLHARGNCLYPHSAVVWFGIVPVPGSLVIWVARRFSSESSRR